LAVRRAIPELPSVRISQAERECRRFKTLFGKPGNILADAGELFVHIHLSRLKSSGRFGGHPAS